MWGNFERGWGAHWRHLANTIEPPLCSGDAALHQITLTTCSFYARLFNASVVIVYFLVVGIVVSNVVAR